MAPRFRLAAVAAVVLVVLEELVVVVEVVGLRAVVGGGAPVRDRAMLFRILVATPAPLPPGVTAGLAMPDLPGVAATRL